MKILLIILLILALLLLCLLLVPWRLRVELAAGRLRADLLLIFGCKIKLFEREALLPADVVAVLKAIADGDWEKVADFAVEKILLRGDKKAKYAETAESKENDKSEEKPPKKPDFTSKITVGTVMAVIGGVLAALHVRKLRVAVLVGGEPYPAAMLAGGIWAGLSAGLARLSAAVASWAASQPEIGLLQPGSSLLDSRIELETEVSVRPGAAIWQVLRRILAKN